MSWMRGETGEPYHETTRHQGCGTSESLKGAPATCVDETRAESRPASTLMKPRTTSEFSTRGCAHCTGLSAVASAKAKASAISRILSESFRGSNVRRRSAL